MDVKGNRLGALAATAARPRRCAGAPYPPSPVPGMLRGFAAARAAPSGAVPMHTVVNRITPPVPVEEVVADIERGLPVVIVGLEGFV